MADTEGLKVQSGTVSVIPDGGNFVMEVYDPAAPTVVIDTVPIPVVDGAFDLDVPVAVSQTYPSPLTVRFVAVTPNNEESNLNVDIERISQSADLLVINCPLSTASFEMFARNSDGTDGLSVNNDQIDEGSGDYNTYVDFVNVNENYVGLTVPVGGRLKVDGVDVPFEGRVDKITHEADSQGLTNKYIYSAPTVSTTAGAMTYAQIEAVAPSSLVFDDDISHVSAFEYYLAEYLYQSPDVCYWMINNGVITPVAKPTAPSNAILLPGTTGGDDTAMLESAMNSPGSYIGNGTYKINGLDINPDDVDVYNFNATPYTNAGVLIRLNGIRNRFIDYSLDIQNQNSVYTGFDTAANADEFGLIGGEIKSFYHQRGAVGADNYSACAIRIRGAQDYHVACNHFEDLINHTGVTNHGSSTVSAEMRAIWINANNGADLSNGYIVNNTGDNCQSSGSDEDGEFVAIQSHTNNNTLGAYPRVFANRLTNFGKRLSKNQSAGILALSNDYWWKDVAGDLPENRRMLSMCAAPWSAGISGIVHRNNRLRDSTGEFERFVDWGTNGTPSNCHYDGNIMTIDADSNRTTGGNPFGGVLMGLTALGGNPNTPVNCSMRNNITLGAGRQYWNYRFDGGTPSSAALDRSGNVFAQTPQVADIQ